MQKAVLCFLLLALVAPLSFGAAFSFNPGDVNGWFDDNLARTLGYQFSVNTTVSVTRLGFVDEGQDGFAEAHGLAIWELNGSVPLVTASIGAGGGVLDGMFRWVTVSGVTLQPGTEYIILGSYAGADVWTWNPVLPGFPQSVSNLVQDPRVQLAGPGYIWGKPSSTDVTEYPNWRGLDNGDPYRSVTFGPNFDMESAVPEPGTAATAALALVGAILVRRRGPRSGR